MSRRGSASCAVHNQGRSEDGKDRFVVPQILSLYVLFKSSSQVSCNPYDIPMENFVESSALSADQDTIDELVNAGLSSTSERSSSADRAEESALENLDLHIFMNFISK